MFDSAQRNIHYLRLSVTDLCNLRCRYCMPDGVEKLEREAVLTYEEFLRLAALFARCGVDTVRVTGGEPLVRKGVDQLVAGLKAIPGICKVTMTTNGILLAQQLPALLAAGLDSVNISLDTLRPEVFQSITARDEFEHVMEGIRAALDSGIPVKLNCVPQVGVNEGELEDLAALAESRPLQVRFIEMMPIGYGAAMPCISGPELRERFARRWPEFSPLPAAQSAGFGDGPAVYYTVPGAPCCAAAQPTRSFYRPSGRRSGRNPGNIISETIPCPPPAGCTVSEDKLLWEKFWRSAPAPSAAPSRPRCQVLS